MFAKRQNLQILFQFANSINDFDSVVFRKICNKFLKWFSIAKRNNSKKRKKKTSLFLRCDFVFFCQIGVVNRVFSIFFLSFKQMAFFLATNGFFLALRKHSPISS